MSFVEVLQVDLSLIGKGVEYALVKRHVLIFANGPMLINLTIKRFELEACSWVKCEIDPVLRLNEEAALE